ncbi:MAG: type II toxin-antitoxin system VapC family toxin [Brevundimonas sp.]
MNTVTIDASAAVSWLFPAQASGVADAFLNDSADRRLAAPGIFAWEVGNLIATRSRRAGMDPTDLCDRLEALGIEIAPAPSPEAVLETVGAAAALDLTLFDTAYLLHAMNHGGGLASRDRRLLDAARSAGVDVFDLRD